MSVLGWLLLLLIPVLLIIFTRRGTPRVYAVRRVVKIFRNCKAIDAESALTLNELGFKPDKHQGNQFISLLFGGWGLKEEETMLDALHSMIKDSIIKSTPEGKLYLSETRLKASSLYRDYG